jgi:hypothetical protein
VDKLPLEATNNLPKLPAAGCPCSTDLKNGLKQSNCCD